MLEKIDKANKIIAETEELLVSALKKMRLEKREKGFWKWKKQGLLVFSVFADEKKIKRAYIYSYVHQSFKLPDDLQYLVAADYIYHAGKWVNEDFRSLGSLTIDIADCVSHLVEKALEALEARKTKVEKLLSDKKITELS